MNKLSPATQSWLWLLLAVLAAMIVATTAVMTAPGPGF